MIAGTRYTSRVSSSIRVEGVAAILEDVRASTCSGMKARLESRRGQGRSDLSDEEIESLSRIAGVIARTAAANGIAEAYQMGVNRSVTRDEHDRPTSKVPPPLRK